MDICFEGIGQVTATFQTKDKLLPGMAVALTSSGEVGLHKEEVTGPLCGVTVSAERGGAVAVQIGGVVKVECPDEGVPAVGWNTLTCDAKGKVAVSRDGGTSCLVLAVDAEEKTAVIKL